MKPVYEIVRAEELRVGDVAQWSGTDCEILGKIQEDERGDILFQFFSAGAYFSKKVFYRIELYRQLPPERNPEVLMRALRLAIFALYDAKLYVPTAEDPQNYIQQAIRELESEAGK